MTLTGSIEEQNAFIETTLTDTKCRSISITTSISGVALVVSNMNTLILISYNF